MIFIAVIAIMFATEILHLVLIIKMKKTAPSILVYFLFCIVIYMSQTGCANIIPPGGGPRDSLPPVLISALPKDSSKNFTAHKIVLNFNEYVEVKEVSSNLIVSPLPKNTPTVEYKLKTVTIKLKDSLEPNTTYSLNFGNSIADVNEGNIFRNFTYVFSTGNTIDSSSLSGKILLAETGKADTTLVAALYNNIADTAVYKLKPKYIATIQRDGSFNFKYLAKGVYALYAIPNDFSKKYDDSTKLFAFADSLIVVENKTTAPATLYAYQEFKREEKKTATTAKKTTTKKSDEKKYVTYTTSLEAFKQDILQNTLELHFTTPLSFFNAERVILTDTNYNKLPNYTLAKDTSNTKIILTTQWKENFAYKLIMYKDALKDSAGNGLAKNDTIKFFTKKETDYGSVKIRFNNLDTTKFPVLQIYKQTELIEAIKITQKEFSRKLFTPGDYELKILYDKNNNGIYDAGSFKKKLQPEIIVPLDKKLSVRANWDNETEIFLKPQP